jgi:isoamylase
MIAFRKWHPSLCRSRFWREDISWYGVGPTVDLSPDSRSLAFCLHGAAQADEDIYVMINAYWHALRFQIQEGAPDDWLRIADTDLPSPSDFSEMGSPIQQREYQVGPRSIVVLVRAQAKSGSAESSQARRTRSLTPINKE